MARDYPRLGYISKRRQWQETPKNAPNCDVIGCTAKAAYRVDIQVNWFRGEDEVASACEAHKSSKSELLAGIDKQEADREARRRAQNPPTKGEPT